MSSLLDFTVQGDVGTMTDESKLPQVKLMAPLQLYRLWERQNWVSHEIDLVPDRREWESLPAELREEMLWGLSAFFVGEERVTSQFSGLVMAAEDKHEEAFLLTQQVDEARHAQHFNRLYEEVFRYDGSFEERLEFARRDLSPDYFKLFDGHLVDDHQALLSDPFNMEAKVDFVTTYHMVIEGTLALTGQYFQTDNMERRGILPGHLKAFNLIAQDEHRHVAYGTWFLQQKARDPELAKRIAAKLAETLPAAAGVLVPPGFQLGDDYEYLGYSGQAMNEFAFTALSRRLRVIGVEVPAVVAWARALPGPRSRLSTLGDRHPMTALALMLRPTTDGWGVYLTNGRELARYRGICSKQLALRYLRRYVRDTLTPRRPPRIGLR